MIFIIIFFGLWAGLLFVFLFERIWEFYKTCHPEKFYGGEIYKSELITITPEIKVLNDLSKEQNILNAQTKVIEEIVVQETSNKNYVREVISGKLIPVSFENTFYYSHTRYSNYEHCVFVRCKDLYHTHYNWCGYNVGKFWKHTDYHLEEISAKDLEKYIEKRKGKYGDFNSFGEHLDYIFNEGERYYQESKSKGMLSESKKKLEILQKIK